MFFNVLWHIIRAGVLFKHGEIMVFSSLRITQKSNSFVFLSDNDIFPSVFLYLSVFGWDARFRQ